MSATSPTLGGHSFKVCLSVECKEKLSPKDKHAFCIWCLTPDHFDGSTLGNVTHLNQTCPYCLEFKKRAYAERSGRRMLGKGVTSKAFRLSLSSGQPARSSGIQGAQFDSEHPAPLPPAGVTVVQIGRSAPVAAGSDPSGDEHRASKQSRKSAPRADKSGHAEVEQPASAHGLDVLSVSHVSSVKGMIPVKTGLDTLGGEAQASRLRTVPSGADLPRTDTVYTASGLVDQATSKRSLPF
jgi:hypothetical protein